jgi:hypothetical protein
LDALTSILLYACAAIAVAGSLGVAIAPPALRTLSLIVMTAGTAALLVVLSAAFAAAAFLVVGLAAALLVGGAALRPTGLEDRRGLALQLGGVTAALLFALLAYTALKGSFGHGAYAGGLINSAAVARLLVDRDAMAGVAVGGILLVAVAGAAASWRTANR